MLPMPMHWKTTFHLQLCFLHCNKLFSSFYLDYECLSLVLLLQVKIALQKSNITFIFYISCRNHCLIHVILLISAELEITVGHQDIGHFPIISCFCQIKGLFGLPLCLNDNNMCDRCVICIGVDIFLKPVIIRC